jgi:hypothetical protein
MSFSLAALRAAKALLAECSLKDASALLAELSGGAVRAPREGDSAGDSSANSASQAQPESRKRRLWTEEEKKAAGERMKKRWASGAMKGKVGAKRSGKS